MIGYATSIHDKTIKKCEPAIFASLINSAAVRSTQGEIEDAYESVLRGSISREEFDEIKSKLKKTLPIITPHATFRFGRRLNRDAQPTGLSMFDIDHINAPRDFYKTNIEGKEEQLHIALAHVTPSTEGLRIVFQMPEGFSLEKAQKWFAKQIGLETFDEACKDYARCSFLVPSDYILYINEKILFEPIKETYDVKDFDADEQGTEQPKVVQFLQKIDKVHESVKLQNSPAQDVILTVNKLAQGAGASLTYRGVPYSDIIKAWWRVKGAEPSEGDRNMLLSQLAINLRPIADNSAQRLLEILPDYGLGKSEMQSIVRSAMKEEYRRNYLSKDMQKALALATNSNASEEDSKDENPPEMPSKLPKLIALLTSCTPDVYKPAVAHAVFPSLATHLCGVTFRYLDGVAHEATLMNVLMAGTGAGKSCITEPINRIMADIRARDAVNLQREAEWKVETNTKGANKDKKARPADLIIQEVDPDMTNPAFVLRTSEAQGHFLYCQMNEIDQFNALRGSGGGGQQFQIMCLAFDPGNRYGQTRVGAQSVTAKVQIRFNWNAATTIDKGCNYFRKVITDGPVSRINFCTIPEREIGSDMPVYGSYGADFDQQLAPFIENLTAASGEVVCEQAADLVLKLKDKCQQMSVLSQSRTYENLSFRALVIAWLKACVLYVANGQQWEQEIEDFVEWSLDYDLWCKMRFFGDEIEKSVGANKLPSAGPRNMLELLPETFTKEQVKDVRQRQGLDPQGSNKMLYNWLSRGYIQKIKDNTYKRK